VPLLYVDTYAPRVEKRIVEQWTADPPEFAAYGNFLPCKGAAALTPESLQQWLLSTGYVRVWQSDDQQISLWRRSALGTDSMANR